MYELTIEQNYNKIKMEFNDLKSGCEFIESLLTNAKEGMQVTLTKKEAE